MHEWAREIVEKALSPYGAPNDLTHRERAIEDAFAAALADRLAALMAALEAADRFGREVTRRMLILPDGMCAACGAQLPPAVHHPGCWLRPLVKDVRETFAVAGVPMTGPR